MIMKGGSTAKRIMVDKVCEAFFDQRIGNVKHHAVCRVKQAGRDTMVGIEPAQQCLVKRDLREMVWIDGINR